ncbi:cupin domain-containing protein [bacterium]|nr:cupin domain-containing protein [bacterium]
MKPVIKKATQQDKANASSWPIWEKEISSFPWQYSEQESCLILQGKAAVINETGEKFTFSAGDFVVFPKGMSCEWIIEQDIKKHYNFG